MRLLNQTEGELARELLRREDETAHVRLQLHRFSDLPDSLDECKAASAPLLQPPQTADRADTPVRGTGDGGSRGNGRKDSIAGAGMVMYNGKKSKDILFTESKYLGKGITNNVAEYRGLLAGLRICIKHNIKNLHVYGDSKLVIQQVLGNWKVKNKTLLPIYNEIQRLKLQFTMIKFEHVYRDFNKRADELANEALRK